VTPEESFLVTSSGVFEGRDLMNRIIRTVLASVGAAAVVSGGALGVAYATAPAPAKSTGQGAASSAGLNTTVDDLVTQINKLEKDLSEPMPTLTTSTPTPEADSAPAAPAATRAAAKAPAAPAATAAARTTQHDDSNEKSGDSKKDSND
jgi:hypothetical protein